MTRSDLLGTTGKRDVDGCGIDGCLHLRASQRLLAVFQRCFDNVARIIDGLSDGSALILGNLPHVAQIRGERTGFAHNGDADSIQSVRCGRFLNLGERLFAQLREFVRNSHAICLSLQWLFS